MGFFTDSLLHNADTRHCHSLFTVHSDLPFLSLTVLSLWHSLFHTHDMAAATLDVKIRWGLHKRGPGSVLARTDTTPPVLPSAVPGGDALRLHTIRGRRYDALLGHSQLPFPGERYLSDAALSARFARDGAFGPLRLTTRDA